MNCTGDGASESEVQQKQTKQELLVQLFSIYIRSKRNTILSSSSQEDSTARVETLKSDKVQRLSFVKDKPLHVNGAWVLVPSMNV